MPNVSKTFGAISWQPVYAKTFGAISDIYQHVSKTFGAVAATNLQFKTKNFGAIAAAPKPPVAKTFGATSQSVGGTSKLYGTIINVGTAVEIDNASCAIQKLFGGIAATPKVKVIGAIAAKAVTGPGTISKNLGAVSQAVGGNVGSGPPGSYGIDAFGSGQYGGNVTVISKTVGGVLSRSAVVTPKSFGAISARPPIQFVSKTVGAASQTIGGYDRVKSIIRIFGASAPGVGGIPKISIYLKTLGAIAPAIGGQVRGYQLIKSFGAIAPAIASIIKTGGIFPKVVGAVASGVGRIDKGRVVPKSIGATTPATSGFSVSTATTQFFKVLATPTSAGVGRIQKGSPYLVFNKTCGAASAGVAGLTRGTTSVPKTVGSIAPSTAGYTKAFTEDKSFGGISPGAPGYIQGQLFFTARIIQGQIVGVSGFDEHKFYSKIIGAVSFGPSAGGGFNRGFLVVNGSFGANSTAVGGILKPFSKVISAVSEGNPGINGLSVIGYSVSIGADAQAIGHLLRFIPTPEPIKHQGYIIKRAKSGKILVV